MVVTKITTETVRLVTDEVKKLTGGAFAFGYARSDVDGSVYVDGVRQKVWRGRNAGRKAIAYYLGAADAYNPGTIGDLPEVLRGEIRRAVMGTTGAQAQYDEGAEDGNARRFRNAR